MAQIDRRAAMEQQAPDEDPPPSYRGNNKGQEHRQRPISSTAATRKETPAQTRERLRKRFNEFDANGDVRRFPVSLPRPGIAPGGADAG